MRTDPQKQGLELVNEPDLFFGERRTQRLDIPRIDARHINHIHSVGVILVDGIVNQRISLGTLPPDAVALLIGRIIGLIGHRRKFPQQLQRLLIFGGLADHQHGHPAAPDAKRERGLRSNRGLDDIEELMTVQNAEFLHQVRVIAKNQIGGNRHILIPPEINRLKETRGPNGTPANQIFAVVYDIGRISQIVFEGADVELQPLLLIASGFDIAVILLFQFFDAERRVAVCNQYALDHLGLRDIFPRIFCILLRQEFPKSAPPETGVGR